MKSNKKNIKSESMSYKSFVADLNQTGSTNPTYDEYDNSCGAYISSRDDVGCYSLVFSSVISGKAWVEGQLQANNIPLRPIYNVAGTLIGFFKVNASVYEDGLNVYIYFFNNIVQPIEISEYINSPFTLPEIRVYQN